MDSYGGSAPSGDSFDPVAFIRKPQVILRLVGILCAIIVFACISDKVYVHGRCYYDGDDNACQYGIAIGVIAFGACLAFLFVDFLVDRQSNTQMRMYMVLSDLVFSAIWALMWFIGFCYLTDKWRRTDDKVKDRDMSNHAKNNARAAIAFSFFSIIIWVALAVLAFFRYRKGPGSFFDEQRSSAADPGYSSFPGQPDLSESYQQPPFSGEKSSAPQYQPPTY